MSGLPGLLSRSAAPKIASGPRLGRAVKRAIFVPFRQAALRPGRRKLREAGFVIILTTDAVNGLNFAVLSTLSPCGGKP